ncbi:MAG: hypothetical protein HYV08_04975 [Deltaproteobacteria bacterium]|nr:hypothetical protein [Deltaproteobacteria bacterium]
MPPLTARVAPARAEGVSWLRLSLPRGTPPGSYTGTVQIEGREQPIIVDVERDIDLRLFPDALSLAAPPGAVVHVDLSVVNAGNVVCEIRRAYAFGVSVMGGVEEAVGQALRAQLAQGERRIDRFAEELANAHGGLVRVSVREGAGPLRPGESRELRVALHLPDRLQAGHTYTGTWPLHDLNCYVRVDATHGRPSGKPEEGR